MDLRDQHIRVKKYYDSVADSYDEECKNLFMRELYDKITWYYVEPFLPKEGIVLDAGGGTGKWSIPIAEKGLRVILYDISPKMLEIAEKKIREKNLQDLIKTKFGDICEISFPDETFDFILAENDPISYCSDPERAVKEFYRVLKPGCYICAGVDSLFSILRHVVNRMRDIDAAFEILKERRIYEEHMGFHWWLFTPRSLRELFEGANLQVLRVIGKTIVYDVGADPLLKDPRKAKKLLELELALCEEESLIGYGMELHVVARKPEN